jgi:hypothetical protein
MGESPRVSQFPADAPGLATEIAGQIELHLSAPARG